MPFDQTILMCAPTYFGVSYVINPWMEGHFNDTNRDLAQTQWENLRDKIATHADIVYVPPQPGLPDIVFTANAGLVLGKKAIVSRFRSVERQGEESFFDAAFRECGFDIVKWPQDIPFEGAGDALFDRGADLLWVGHGFRTHAAVPAMLADKLGCKTAPLNLVNPRFYHLDTCLCPLTGGFLLYFPEAFDAASRALIEATVPADKRIIASEEDAMQFCCNAVDLGGFVYMNHASEALQNNLKKAGFTPVITPLSEFMKAGGAAKCLTLKLVEA